MSIKLKDYLLRKRVRLDHFIKKNNIKDYQEILDYCQQRECVPISKEEFDLLVPSAPAKPAPALQKKASKPKIVKKEVEAVDEKKTTKPKATRKRKSTISRSTQKVQEEGPVDTPVEDS